ncbi:MAG: hypothetical protein ABI415_02670, partial [Flavitalea sp.]
MKIKISMRYRNLTTCLFFFSTLLWMGCSKHEFNSRNTDPTRVTVLSPTDIKGAFPSALYAGMNSGPGVVDYQQAQNLFAD